jgi:MerR family transcriptional regulator, thiopeptide resistance regulator
MTTPPTYRVKEVADMTGVSVRALHHYDEIGLLVPAHRSEAGYRLYRSDDLVRLQQILIGRALGMPLEEIRRFLDAPQHDRRAALERQRALLAARAERTAVMLRAVEAALTTLTEGERTMKDMSHEEVIALFDGFDPAQHEAEAEARWGHTDAYAESARRTREYTKADWVRYKDEVHAIMSDAAALFGAGAPPQGEDARAIAERHRCTIDRWFYPCSATMHENLADMYEADARFAANIDKYGDGLTAWLAAAIRANAAR